MSDDKNKTDKTGLDLIGLGKMANAIPKEVYGEVTRSLIDKFDKIISPITEITSGFGRYLKQKFDNMVEVEKAIGALTVERAIEKARIHGIPRPPKHLKSFIQSFEEASKETDAILHEMWQNILASQLVDSDFHPRYVNMLSSLSAAEATLLLDLNPVEHLGKDFSNYLGSPRDGFDHYVLKNHDTNLYKWTYSCNLLLDLDLAEVMAPNRGIYNDSDNVTILYRTKSGTRFLEVVSA